MYDEGMVYDIMEEIIDKKYSFSIIDCNSRVEGCRDGHQNMILGLLDPNACNNAYKEFN